MKPFIIIIPIMRANGMALFPFILIKNKVDRGNLVLINHEKIHLSQQLELLILPFYLLYFLNYLFGLVKYRNHYLAYFNIIFEKEAYQNEHNLNYLHQRKFWAWLKLFTKKQPYK